MNILVTGSNGQLGHEMRFVSRYSQDHYYFADIQPGTYSDTLLLDITDVESVRQKINELDIDAVVNCAAFTNVDAAESQEDIAERLNADAPAYLAEAMKERGGFLIHISTDYVFGKEPYNLPCNEEQTGTPTGVYGRTKLHGEQRIRQIGCKYVIVRTAWLYSPFGKNFCKTMMDLTANREELMVVFDQVGTPTYAFDLALAISRILKDYGANGLHHSEYVHTGVYHYSNEGVCSWFDFAQMIARYCEHTSCRILPCHSNEFPSPVKRPAYSVLDKTKIKETFGLEIPYWTESLKECIQIIKANIYG